VVSEADAEEDQGGVVLRREQVKAVLLGQRPMAEKQAVDDAELEAGSMSRLLRRRMVGYEGLPEWTNDPTDSTLRDSEVSTAVWNSG
jgi:AP-3 complex subunit beta